ncbi:MAG: hypothetical protein ACOY3I_01830 [Verrucomicrobiota bacterium]
MSYALLGVLIFLPCLWGFIYPDIWWQLKEGYFILHHGAFPARALNAFGVPNHPFPHEYVFYELFIASIHWASGWFGLRLFFMLLAVVPFGYALYWVAQKQQWNFVNFYLLALAYLLLLLRIQQRPELLANVYFIGVLHVLLMEKRKALPLFVLFCLWANTHASFIVGFGAVGLWMMNECMDQKFKNLRSMILLGLASLLGALLNPQGAAYLLEPFRLQSAVWSKMTSGEMFPLPIWGYPLIAGTLIVGVWVCVCAGWKKHVWLMALLGATILLSIKSQRYTNLVGCVACALIFVNTDSKKPFSFFKHSLDEAFTVFVAAPILSIIGILLLPTIPGNLFSVDYIIRFSAPLIRAMPDENKKVLTEISTGSYINGNTQNLRAFLDTGFNRFAQENMRYYYYLDNHPEALGLALDHLNANYVIVGKFNHHWSFVLNQHPRWKLAKVASQSALYERVEKKTKPSGRMVSHLEKTYIFYAPGNATLRYTLNSLDEGRAWSEEKFYTFFHWWLERQNPQDLENYLKKDAVDLKPSFELMIRRVLHQVNEDLLENKKYRVKDEFDRILHAQIYLDLRQSGKAREVLRKGNFGGSIWRNELMQVLDNKMNLDLYVWNEDNKNWFLDFTQKLNNQ